MKFYTNVKMIGNQFLVRGVENGKRYEHRDNEFSPTLFANSRIPTKYKTLNGDYVKPINPGSVKECRNYYKEYENVDGFDIYGNDRYIYQYISDKYPQDEIKFDISQIKLVTLDIEVASEQGFPDVESCSEEILAITIQDYTTKAIITWGSKPFIVKQENVTYYHRDTEEKLLGSFLQYWMNDVPDVVTGWNIQLYDIPYIAKRITQIFTEKDMKRLSPWGLVSEGEVYISHRKHTTFDIAGVTQLDYMDLYKKFTYKAQESYRLDYIASVELGQKKLDHSEFDTFKQFYTKGWQKFIEYNIVDVELVDRLEDKMKLIELALTMAYDAKVNYEDVFYQVRMWDTIIYNYLKKKNIVIPSKEKTEKDDKYAGAYVKEPIPGKYDWVVNFDLNSLYPHLIMQYNISPETLVEKKHPDVSVDKILNQEIDITGDYAVCANGAQYRKDIRGFLPELMDKMYGDRVIFKNKMIEAKKQYEKTPTVELTKEIARCNNIQMAKKISLNSAYGAIGNQYFRYYKLANAEAITLSGQVSIRWIENKMNEYLNKILKTEDKDYVIASDTDSIYLNMGSFVESVYKGREKTTEDVVSFLDKVCEMEFEKYISSSYEALAKYVNAYDQKMFMKRENIADRGIWTAKKRYILNVWDSEGVRYEEPKLKMMGIEAIKSSTPAPCRQMIKDALKIMMNGTENELSDFIDDCRNKFKTYSAEDIAFPRSISEISKYKFSEPHYVKLKLKGDQGEKRKVGKPIHVQGALFYNFLIKEKNLSNKYEVIKNGEKIKFCHILKNPYEQNVISFIQELPKEFELDNKIDYDLQFEKSFLEPLKIIFNSIGWNPQTQKTATLEAFFT